MTMKTYKERQARDNRSIVVVNSQKFWLILGGTVVGFNLGMFLDLYKKLLDIQYRYLWFFGWRILYIKN